MEPGLRAGSYAANAGYSRRCLPGDAKTTDRQKLLTDRNAYISYLEAQAQRAGEAAAEAEAAGSGMRQLQTRVEYLEEKGRETSRAVELAHETTARACRQELEGPIRQLEGRVHRLEQMGVTTDSEIARLRNEVSLSAHELGQHLDARVQTLRERLDEHARGLNTFADNGASLVIREAQATCVRLADDALGASEASQRKLEELARQTEAAHKQLEDVSRRTDVALEVIRADIIGIRAEQARSASAESLAVNANGQCAGPVSNTARRSGSVDKDNVSGEIADEVEKRVGMRLGQQVLQLSEALRRVVQAQQCLARSGNTLASSSAHTASAPNVRSRSVPNAAAAHPVGIGNAGTLGGEGQRRAAIEDLYRELWQLEEGGRSPSRASSRPQRSRGTPRRHSRNTAG